MSPSIRFANFFVHFLFQIGYVKASRLLLRERVLPAPGK
jgi:hypothetical protein